ncbi:copper chaperone PCu(A)C [Novosphingobium sp. KCTC 2891]|uniref:copper chaperone PCu(A)C n=1 Tax=Novosphingobium sp. KCTC 2891 TaxID=2989730 RepID=UPI002221517A|nr:copper chaperone PCu(A)C [Novosphingobium sp. KCTC 2891]MCW1381661.1 copper chaperone PCu(A)C [Novosphingobium sp. KCTC 2891]
MRANAFAPALIAAAGLSLALAGCGEKPTDSPSASASAPAEAAPEAAPGITLSDAVVQLPAVPGRPGVAYFTLAQGNGAPRKLAAVHVDGAERAEMHRSAMHNGVATMAPVTEVALAPGKAVQFAPGGYHVMLFGVSDSLKAGSTTELTITLDNGDKASVSAKVQSIGGDMHNMDGADHDMKM